MCVIKHHGHKRQSEHYLHLLNESHSSTPESFHIHCSVPWGSWLMTSRHINMANTIWQKICFSYINWLTVTWISLEGKISVLITQKCEFSHHLRTLIFVKCKRKTFEQSSVVPMTSSPGMWMTAAFMVILEPDNHDKDFPRVPQNNKRAKWENGKLTL